MMVIDNKFQLGDIVYLKTDSDQKRRMVGKISVSQMGLIYLLMCGTDATEHYEIEITNEKEILVTI